MKTLIDATLETLDGTNPAWATTTCNARWYGNALAGNFFFSTVNGGGAGGIASLSFDCSLQAWVAVVNNATVFEVGPGQVTALQPTRVAVISGTAPVASITAGAVAQIGTGGTVVCASSHVCDDISGELTVTTGTGVLSSGTLATITFAHVRANAPNCAYEIEGASGLVPTKTESTTLLTLGVAAALANTTTYTANYVCGGI